MNKDFYVVIENEIASLNNNEKKVLEYVVKNIDAVKDMGIRDLADEMFVSSTSIFRFVKKLGFKGYSEFISCLNYTSYKNENNKIPKVLEDDDYKDAYLDNILESIRVLSKSKVKKFTKLLETTPKIFFITSGLCKEVARYASKLFSVYGFVTIAIEDELEVLSAMKQVANNDILFVIANSEYHDIVGSVEKIKSEADVKVVSITAATNNVIQSITDIDFYVFSDDVYYNTIDVTSRVSMMAIIELLGISYIKQQSPKNSDKIGE